MKKKATFFAILAAVLYAIHIPLAKLLLEHISAAMMAGLLYFGAGMGMLIYFSTYKLLGKAKPKEAFTRKELPYILGMIVLDIFAPIFLMFGIANTNSANVSLLNNFEIVATSLIALLIFKEKISKRLWLAIGLVAVASTILSFEGVDAFHFNLGSLFVLAACICWGFENNCTKMLSNKSTEEIVIIKGIFSGTGSLLIAWLLGEYLPSIEWIAVVMSLGFVAFGLSINFYILAQKDLGAAKTSAYYSVAPFLGVAFSMLLLAERPSWQFYIALVIMLVSAVLMVKDTISLQHNHQHEHSHNHFHSHGSFVHAHQHTHIHRHLHVHDLETEQHLHQHQQLDPHHHSHSMDESFYSY